MSKNRIYIRLGWKNRRGIFVTAKNGHGAFVGEQEEAIDSSTGTSSPVRAQLWLKISGQPIPSLLCH